MAEFDYVKARANLNDFYQRVIEASNGALNDTRPQSVLSSLGRGFVEALTDLEVALNASFNATLEGTIPLLFGYTTNSGVKAQIMVRVYPARLNTIATLSLPGGFRLSVNGVIFELDSTITLPPGSLYSDVTATAIEASSSGNVPKDSQVNWQVTPNLLNIAYVETLRAGSDPQTIATINDDLVNSLVNRALITTENYKYIAKTVLGDTATIAVEPNLGKDKVTYERGSMHIFGTVEGQTLTTAQKNTLLTELSKGWATVYVSDIEVINIRVQVYIKAIETADKDTVKATVGDSLLNYFDPLNYEVGRDLDLYDTIFYVYGISGVKQVGLLQFDINNTGIFEAKDYVLKSYQTVKASQVIVQTIL